MSKKRSYTLRKRAESQDETRMRIVEAAMRLHEELGPRATTISAIAERAGVQRLTVYRHFPDDTAVFQACTAHWLSLHPLPDPAAWRDVRDAWTRTSLALSAFYRYYRTTERMWTVSYRDEEEVAALRGPMAEVRGFLRSVGEDLLSHYEAGAAGEKDLAATLHHTLAFSTWAALAAQGFGDEEMVGLVGRWIAAVRNGASLPGKDDSAGKQTCAGASGAPQREDAERRAGEARQQNS